MARKWNSGDATKYINEIAKHILCDLLYTKHARDRMRERSITTGDIMHVLRYGFVYEEGKFDETTRDYYKYEIEGKTPNSRRVIRLVVIATRRERKIKIITVMWKDEK